MRFLRLDESSLSPVDRGNTPLQRAQIRAVQIAEVFLALILNKNILRNQNQSNLKKNIIILLG